MDEVVAGALIGLVGGVVGAGIGGATSLLVAARERKQQREDRDVLLWTEQRRVVYLRFLSEAADLERRIEASAHTEAEPAWGLVAHEDRADLMATFNEMRLIAPKDVVEPANNYLYNLSWPLNNGYAYVALAFDARPLDMERVGKTQKVLKEALEEVRRWERETRAAMRENLGTGPEYDLPAVEQQGDEPPSPGGGKIASRGYPPGE
ncbi:hypothetical protein [Promicromonospora sp. NPDC090134]|uniref:hypothetical protein n=1 Tax=Promicromonospora sp. NPDC090134 TaxID=3364408 RepID=UPI0038120FBB